MRETNNGFLQDCVRFDLSAETDIRKPPGIMLASKKSGCVRCLFQKNIQGVSVGLLLCIQTIWEKQTNWKQLRIPSPFSH